ncbi:hypothetical protein L6452_42551 [Arctium lappa]|uniref:Uncharacterized protein n=1 Tax=Arctium lappa TaxID=4217 RepID=A0ACB8XJD0_ARCLA|nr:hypothetical protein L6452_42551 [Arctium lappa]
MGTGTYAEVVRRGLKEESDLEQQSMQRQGQVQITGLVSKISKITNIIVDNLWYVIKVEEEDEGFMDCQIEEVVADSEGSDYEEEESNTPTDWSEGEEEGDEEWVVEESVYNMKDQKIPVVDKEDDKRERVEETVDSKKVSENMEDEVVKETENRPEVVIAGKGVEESTRVDDTDSNAFINELSYFQETQREAEAASWSQNSNRESYVIHGIVISLLRGLAAWRDVAGSDEVADGMGYRRKIRSEMVQLKRLRWIIMETDTRAITVAAKEIDRATYADLIEGPQRLQCARDGGKICS